MKREMKSKFKFKVKEVNSNPHMQDFDGFHYRISIINKKNNLRRSFAYSVGSGHRYEDRTDIKIIEGLLGCLYMDSAYTDYEVFEGLGYNEDSKKTDKIFKAICRNDEKVDELGLRDYLKDYEDR